jgi:hypothetical protein
MVWSFLRKVRGVVVEDELEELQCVVVEVKMSCRGEMIYL